MTERTGAAALAGLPLLFARFVKLEHSVFALPFAYAGAFLASPRRFPPYDKLLWITVVMVAARSLAMGLNRIIDRRIDAKNPRTANRELPSGALSFDQAISFCAISLAALAISLSQLPPLTWYLSPVVIAAFVIYPYTKRFTALCHFFLGATIGLAPVGAWIAVKYYLIYDGRFYWEPFLLMGAVTFWIAGFDIIYACLDIDFDRREGIHSLPAAAGPAAALLIARLFHVLAVAFLLATGWIFHLGFVYYAGVAIVTALLVYENAIVSARDLSRVNTAFMTMNGVIGVVYLAFLAADLYLF